MAKQRLVAATIGSVVAALVVTTASAEITSQTGEVHKGPAPSSVAINQHQHTDTGPQPSGGGAHAFDEEQDYITKTAVRLDACVPGNPSFAVCEPNGRAGTYERPADLVNRGGTVPAGTCIDSHMVHADPPGTSRLVYTGEVSFNSVILGVILTTANLSASDVDPGLAPTTTYGTADSTRGLEFVPSGQPLDSITINVQQNIFRVTFRFDAAGPLDYDQIRIITIGDATKCPGQAKRLTLTPKLAANPVNTQHCVIASVATETGGPARGVVVRFDVEGVSEQDRGEALVDGAATADQNGQARHCYQGSRLVGTDTIHAYADNDRDGVEDIGAEPFDDATKTWLPGDANRLTLEPKLDDNPVNTEHCVTAKVSDVFGNGVPRKRVRFVVTGTVMKDGTKQTDDSGQAQFCYTSTTAGADGIVAHVDETNPGVHDVGEPADVAEKTWTPGKPATLDVYPEVSENPVQSEHCVTATVRDAFLNRVPRVTVRFIVTGVNQQSGARVTDEDGQATFCYTGGTTAGADAIVAYADENKNQVRDVDETAADAAEKTWLPLAPRFLTLTPKEGRNIVNTPHCVQAAVTDIFLNPNPGVLVRFIVTRNGVVRQQASQRTDRGGIAEYCYTTQQAGVDAIHAYADTDENNQQDPGEPSDDATKTWGPDRPAVLDLNPPTGTNEVETEHCLQADVRDQFGNPTPNVTVVFDVEGASEEDTQPTDEDGAQATDEFGHATHCYTGPDLPGIDAIHAYADTDNDGRQDPDETAQDTAEKKWILPPSTPGCEITIHSGGWIVTTLGHKGTFGGNARIEADGAITRGELEYHDHNPLVPINFHSIQVLVIVCEAIDANGDGVDDGQRADIYGTGRVNGIGPADFRVRVRDLGEPGSQPLGPDTYQIITATYASGPEDNPLQGGNIQIHRFRR